MGEFTKSGTKLGTCGCQYALHSEVKALVERHPSSAGEAHGNLQDPSTHYAFPYPIYDYDVDNASLSMIESQISEREYQKTWDIPLTPMLLEALEYQPDEYAEFGICGEAHGGERGHRTIFYALKEKGGYISKMFSLGGAEAEAICEAIRVKVEQQIEKTVDADVAREQVEYATKIIQRLAFVQGAA